MKKIPNSSDELPHISSLINDNLDFINRQSVKTVKLKFGHSLKSKIDLENEADKLFTRVLNKLSDDDYLILRKFEGRSKITTYFTTIIVRTAIDMIREIYGRDRMSVKGSKIRKPVEIDGTSVKEGIYSGEKGEYIVPDQSEGPELKTIRMRDEKKLKSVLSEMVSELTGEESLLLRMKFPKDLEGKSLNTKDIAKMLGITEKCVYSRTERLLKKCRKILIGFGISTEDFNIMENKKNVRHINRRKA